jgi:hypothetical protein
LDSNADGVGNANRVAVKLQIPSAKFEGSTQNKIAIANPKAAAARWKNGIVRRVAEKAAIVATSRYPRDC